MKNDVFERIKDPHFVETVAKELNEITFPREVTLMHVCGTHEHTIARAGLRSLLPEKIRLIAGPGCPVCVCSAVEIDMAIAIAVEHGVILTTFGDMFRVPATRGSMESFKARGADIRVVYSPMDAVEIARANPSREVVFMAVGFETTAAPIAAALLDDPPKNLSCVTSLKLVPPALRFLLDRGATEIDGFILPGHVSTIIGRTAYLFLEDEYRVPSAIAGFEAVDVLMAVKSIARQIAELAPLGVDNLYTRAVRENGNGKALEAIYEIFETGDANWRGIGVIPGTGLRFKEKYRNLDASYRFGLEWNDDALEILPGCLCDKVILGEAEPEECPLFATECTPRKPYGPCMVSSEGTCSARYKYRGIS